MRLQRDEPTEQWMDAPPPALTILPVAVRALTAGVLLSGRYRVAAPLGQGGMGVVYRARDETADRLVAVKAFFPPPGVDNGARRFQREFRALTRLQHPHVVRVFDYGEASGVPYYVMQYIDGVDLSTLRRARGGRLPADALIPLAYQLCDALAYIHAQGIVHRDLKPTNVMLSGSGPPAAADANLQVTLVDFGLAKTSEASAQLTESRAVLGTLGYLSPEQAQSLPLDARTDLYSLGVMLYEMATGQLPFASDTPAGLIWQHLTQTPAPPRSIEPSISPAFESLVLALLAKQPRARPASAEAVMDALASGGQSQLRKNGGAYTGIALTSPANGQPQGIAPTAPRYSADAVFRAGLIGRQAELDRLNLWLDSAWAGDGGLMLIAGEAGVGKSRLAQELAGQVRLRGGVSLSGACHAGEHLAYAPIAAWLDAALQRGGTAHSLVAGLEDELASLLPRLRPAGAAHDALDPSQARLRFYDAVLRALLRLSAQKPLLLLLDDLQWADDASLELLHYLVRNTQGRRLAICATLRTAENAPASALANFLQGLSRLQRLAQIDLPRLAPADTEQLIGALLGLDETPVALAERIFRESEGNPFFVEELLKALAEEGRLTRRAGRWHLRADARITTLRIPSTIRGVIERRLAPLTALERDVLSWAAVLGHEFDYDLLQSAGPFAESALLDALDSLLRSQLIAEVRDPRRDKYRFTHAQIRETVYAGLSAPRRKSMHRAAGASIERLHAAQLAEHSPLLALHFTAGGDVPRAIQYSVQAGEFSRRLYANQESVALYRQVIELAAESPDYLTQRIAAHRGLGDVYHLTGDYALAAENFRAVIALASDAEPCASAWRALGQTHEARGAHAEAIACYEQGLSALQTSESTEWARLANALAWVNIRQANYARAEELCAQVIASAGDVGDVAATAYGYLGAAARLQGDFERATDCHRRSLALWQQAGDKAQAAHELNRLGVVAEAKGDNAGAIEYYAQALATSREIGHSLGIAFLLNNLGVVYQNQGQTAQARGHFQQSLGIFQRIGSQTGLAMAYNNLAETCITLNQLSEAQTYLARAEAINQERGNPSSLAYTWLLMAELALAEHRMADAASFAARASALTAASGTKAYAAKLQRILQRLPA